MNLTLALSFVILMVFYFMYYYRDLHVGESIITALILSTVTFAILQFEDKMTYVFMVCLLLSFDILMECPWGLLVITLYFAFVLYKNLFRKIKVQEVEDE